MENKFVNIQKEANIKLTEHSTSTSLDGAVKIRFAESGLTSIKAITIAHFFKNCCQRYAEKPALAFKVPETSLEKQFAGQPSGKKWTIISYAEFSAKVQHVSHILIHIGLKARMAVGILANNCPEWFFLQFGILQAGGVVFGIYPTSSADAVYHMLAITEATICVVDDAEHLKKVRMVCSRLPKLKSILVLHGACEEEKSSGPSCYCWSDLMTLCFNDELNEELKKREREQFANECAMVVFTSGTIGMPKAVLLSHDNIIYNVKASYSSPKNVCWGEGRVVSYLPLSHIAAQAFEIFAAILTGACVYFAEKDALKGTLVQTLREVKPTMFLGVPRIYEKLQERLLLEQKRKGTLSKCIENQARDAVTLNNICKANCPVEVSIKDTFANYIIDNTRKVIGMECCRLFYCGGAPLATNIKEYFTKFDVTIIDAYGLSELAGPATMNCSQLKLTSVGKPIDGTKLKIRKTTENNRKKQGEILFFGRHVFMGYLNDPRSTAAVIDEYGWFHTGDLGYTDQDGDLFNVGRIKEIIITSGSENIAPVPIEEALKSELSALSNVMVVGDKRKYLTVMLTLKTVLEPSVRCPTDILHIDTKQWLKSLGLNFQKLSTLLETFKDPESLETASKITHSIMMIIDRVNKCALSNAQHIKKFLLLRHDFSVATGELGPSLKIRRNFVLKKYAQKIDEMYR